MQRDSGTSARLFQEPYGILKCHDLNGEIFMVTINRGRVSLTSYSDDSIKTKVETWADTVAALV